MRQVSLRETFSGLGQKEKLSRYRELWYAAERFEVLTDFPLHLDLELSGLCNLCCDDCFQEELDKKKLGLMKSSMFRRIIDEGVPKGLCAVKLQIRGESFLHPEILDLIRYAKEKGVLDVQITTNGTLLNNKVIDEILKSGLDGIIFSVDPRHEEACLESKIVSTEKQIPDVVKIFLERRQELGASKPWVRIQSNTNDSSEKGLCKLKSYIEKEYHLADIFSANPIFNFRKDQDSYDDLHENYIMKPCAYLMQRIAVFWNGETTVCCMDYHGDFKLGSTYDKSIEEIWNSKKLNALRKAHLSGRRKELPICKHCHVYAAPANRNVYIDAYPRNRVDFDLSGPKRQPKDVGVMVNAGNPGQ